MPDPGALDAGQVVVSLFGDFKPEGFDRFDQAIKEASGRTAEATLSARVDDTGFGRFRELVSQAGQMTANATLGFNVKREGETQATGLVDQFGRKIADATLGFKVDDTGEKHAEAEGETFARKDYRAKVSFATDEASAAKARTTSESVGKAQDELGTRIQRAEQAARREGFEINNLSTSHGRLSGTLRESSQQSQASAGSSDRYSDALRRAENAAKGAGLEVERLSLSHGRYSATLRDVSSESDRTSRAHDNLSAASKRTSDAAKQTSSVMEQLKGATAIAGSSMGLMAAAAITAAPGINALGGSVISLAGALGPLSGLAVSVVPAFLGLKASQDLVKDAFTGVSKAVEGNAEAYKKLDPAQKAFVDHLKASGIELDIQRARLDSHRQILDGTGQAFDAIRPHIDVFTGVMHTLSGAIGEIIGNFGRMLASADALKGIDSLGAQATMTIKALGSAATDLVHAFLIVTQVAEPLTNWLSQLAIQGGRWVLAATEAAQRTGQLNLFFDHTREIATTLGHIIANLAVVLFDFFKAGRESGQGLLDTFANLTAKWREWASSVRGQNELRDYFNRAEAATKAILTTLGELTAGIVKVTQPTQQWTNAWKDMSDHAVTPLVQTLGTLVRTVGPAVLSFIGSFAQLLGALQGILPVATGILNVFSQMVRVFTDIVATVPGLKQLIDILGGIAIAWKVLEISTIGVRGAVNAVKDAYYATVVAAGIARAASASFADGGILAGLSTLATRIKGAGTEYNNLKKGTDEAANAASNFSGKAKTAASDAGNLGTSAGSAAGGLRGAGQEAESASTKSGGFAKTIENLVLKLGGPTGLALWASRTAASIVTIGASTVGVGAIVATAVQGFNELTKTLGGTIDRANTSSFVLNLLRQKTQELPPDLAKASAGFDSFATGIGRAMASAHTLTDQGIAQIVSRVNQLPPQMQRAGSDTMIRMTAGLEQSGQLPVGSTAHLVAQIQNETHALPPDAQKQGAALTANLAAGIATGAGATQQQAERMASGVEGQINTMRAQGVQINSDMLNRIVGEWASKQGIPVNIANQIKEGVTAHTSEMSFTSQQMYTDMVNNTISEMVSHQDVPPNVADQIRQQVTDHARTMGTDTVQSYTDMVNQTIDYMVQHQGVPPEIANQIRDQVTGSSRDMALNTIGATKDMVDQASHNFQVYAQNVGQGVGNVGMNVNEALKVFGLSPLNFGFVPAPSPFGTGSASLADAITGSAHPGGGFAVGGPIGRMGAKGRDDILAWLGEGEYVLTSHMQPAVEKALRGMFGIGLHDLQKVFPHAHSHERGGRATQDGIPKFDVGGFPDDFMHPFKAPRATGTNMGGSLVPTSQGGFDKSTDAANKYWEQQMQKLMAGAGGNFGPILAIALAAKGALNPGNLAALTARMMQESGGRNIMQGIVDVNSGGNEARGILQMTPGTFAANAVPGHGDIWNPLDNALSAVDYMLHTYGHIVGGGGDGYARGGLVQSFAGGGMPFLPGMKYEGWDVRQLQATLGVEQTGHYDTPTIAAIRAMQANAGMPPTGIAPQTLREAIIDKKPLTNALSFMKDIFPTGLGAQVRQIGIPFQMGGFIPGGPATVPGAGFNGIWPSWDPPEQIYDGIPLWDSPEPWIPVPPGSSWQRLPGTGKWVLAGNRDLYGDPDDAFYSLVTGKPGRPGGDVGFSPDVFGLDTRRGPSGAGLVGSGFVGFPGASAGPAPRGAPITAAGAMGASGAPGRTGDIYKDYGVLTLYDIQSRLGLDVNTDFDRVKQDDAVIQQLQAEYGLLTKKIGLSGVTTPQDFQAELTYQGLITQQMQSEYDLLQRNALAGVGLTGTAPPGDNQTAPTMSRDDVRAKALAAFTALRAQQLDVQGLVGQQGQQATGDLAKFNAERQALFQGFGSNFVSPFSLSQGAMAGQGPAAAGVRNFGAFSSGTGQIPIQSGQGNLINIYNNYATAPPDPHSFSQALSWEVRVAL